MVIMAFVRHGSTHVQSSKKERYVFRNNLSREGVDQASALGKYFLRNLEAEDVGWMKDPCIFTSERSRARKTGRCIREVLGGDVEIYSSGLLNMSNRQDKRKGKYGEVPNKEIWPIVLNDFLGLLAGKEGQTAICVSHEAWITHVLNVINRDYVPRSTIGNCSLQVLEYGSKKDGFGWDVVQPYKTIDEIRGVSSEREGVGVSDLTTLFR